MSRTVSQSWWFTMRLSPGIVASASIAVPKSTENAALITVIMEELRAVSRMEDLLRFGLWRFFTRAVDDVRLTSSVNVSRSSPLPSSAWSICCSRKLW